MREIDWETLLKRIKMGQCTPFLGAGASAGVLPLGKDVAKKWASAPGREYPLEDSSDLMRVAQHWAVMARDSVLPKQEMIDYLKTFPPPDFSKPDQPHRILASLPLPIYLTTNYDDFMTQALAHKPDPAKDPQEVMCRWNSQLKKEKTIFEKDPAYQPTPQKPAVFHLHGHWKTAQSLVLIEDDYLDFLRVSASDKKLIPLKVEQALAESTVLFLGYAITDWDFRVLFRSVVEYLEKSQTYNHFSIQLKPGDENSEQQAKAVDYLQRYFGKLQIEVYWGNCQDFLAELSKRWEAFRGH